MYMLGISLAFSMLCGCSRQKEEIPKDTDKSISASKAAEKESPEDEVIAKIRPDETVTFDVYSQLSSYFGEQQGWYAQILLEKFNVKLNFINDSSEDMYSRLENSGDLGDIVIWGDDSDQYHSAIAKGLLLDWEEDGRLNTYGSYINGHMAKALSKNKKNSGGHIYGFGYDVATEGGEYGDFDYHPDIRWDLYEQIGMPEVTELEDFVDVLKQMKEICPKSDTGKETYGVSLFSDWDSDMVMYVKSTCTNFFGMDEFGVGLYNVSDGSFEGCLEKDGCYIRALKFYNDLYRNGLLDPESQTQGHDACLQDYREGAAFFCIFGWMAAPEYNSVNHTADGKMMLPLAAKNQNTLVYGLNQNGGNRLWTIGSKTEYPELAMAIINWLCTPEGYLTTEYGPKGIGWDYDLDKNTCLLEPGYQAKTGETVEFAEDSGYSGTWADGAAQFNNTTWTPNADNPESNRQTYNYAYWPNVLGKTISGVEQRWREINQAESAKEYLSKSPYSVSKPNTYTSSVKSPELTKKWEKVTKIIRSGSWSAIFAETEKAFENETAKMQRSADAAGYADCVAWCRREAGLRHASEE